ncbi:MAG: hypothetical protein WCP69_13320 [Bacteroidota bacterium]
MEKKQILIFASTIWSYVSILIQIVCLWFAEEAMNYTTGIFLNHQNSNPTILLIFKMALIALVILNIVSLILSRGKLEGNRFLWFIGITYSTLILFAVVIFSLIANIIWGFSS